MPNELPTLGPIYLNRMLKPTILSLSLLTVMSGAAVAPALARIAAAFPEAGPTSLKMILTLPAIFIIFFSLMSWRLTKYLSKRHLLIIGLLVYLTGGLLGGLASSFEFLLVARGVLGIGVGLIMPLSTGLIADFYAGDERGRLMGYSTAASNFGGIIATLSAGLLAGLSWRYSFGVYGAAVFVFVLVLLYLPNPDSSFQQNVEKSALPFAVYGWSIGAFFLMLAFYAVPVNLAIFLESNDLGGASSAGVAIAVMSAAGFFAGLSFAKVKKALRGLLPTLLFAILGCGYFLLGQANHYSVVVVATGIIGLGLGWAMPLLFTGATKAGGGGKGVQTMAIVSSMLFLGQFMSPLVLDFVGELLGNSSPRSTFGLLAVSFAMLVVVSTFERLLRTSLDIHP